jgi:hypothetical protein
MSLLILRTGLTGVPGDAVGGARWRGRGQASSIFLVVPASRRRREAGRHRGLRGPKAIADQVVVYERFPEGVRP